MTLLVLSISILLAFLVLYHHLVYPCLLRKIALKMQKEEPEIVARRYLDSSQDQDCPTITIVMPAYNEARFIAEKIRNLAQLDYPYHQVDVLLVCDGCSDNTASIADKVSQEAECRDLTLNIIEHHHNRGKLAILNEALSNLSCDVIVLSDVSALLPIDSLTAVATHFKDEAVGAVSGGYTLIKPGSEGESAYWNYQSSIKKQESNTGSVLGSHGAFYAFRNELFESLPIDVINDDFVLPMRIAAKGLKVVYEPRVSAIELETTSKNMDSTRRRRIAAGNMQQLIMLRALLHPSYGWLAFNFISGKALRAIMPFILLVFLACSLYLASDFTLFATIAALQIMVYMTVASLQLFERKSHSKVLNLMCYLVLGYWAALIGSCRYLMRLDRGHWQRVEEK